jgi:hypothetical protein
MKLIGAFAKLLKVTISFIMCVCLSVCLSAQNNSAPTGRIFTELVISRLYFFSKIHPGNSSLIKI